MSACFGYGPVAFYSMFEYLSDLQTRMRYTPDTCKRLWRARTPDPTDDPDVPSNLTAPAQYIRYLKRKCLREEYGSESFERF
eukprot:gene14684-17348_t